MTARIAVALTALLFGAPSVHAQGTNFLELMKTGTPSEVQIAINKGQDVNAGDATGQSALMNAAWRNPNPEMIFTLVHAGASIEARDATGKTALILPPTTVPSWSAQCCSQAQIPI